MSNTSTRVAIAIMLVAIAEQAQAYIGPGAGLGAIGTILAVIGAVVLAVVGFIWYPIKRLLRRSDRNRSDRGPH